jgi:hypothetical protein
MLEFINGIIPNICILLTLTLIYAYILKYFSNSIIIIRQFISGILFGTFAIYGMLTPYVFAPGLIFDGRSIILCASGIIVGFRGTFIAIVFASVYRIIIGGGGAEMGVFVIVTSGLIGSIYGLVRSRKKLFNNAYFIYLTGLLVSLVMVSGTLLLPVEVRSNVFNKIYFPVLLIYPIATLFFVKILDHQKKMQDQHYELIQGRIKLKKAFLQTLSAISKAIEGKDRYTKNHQFRVANLAANIAIYENWSENKIIELYIASLVHDIGKLIIPLNILNKKGELTEEEYEIIKMHSIAGYNIFHELDLFPWKIDKIILQHHEKLDGSGYPNGIKAKDILEASKIIAVCDTFDASTSNRAYQEARNIDNVIEILQKESGKTLDPKYVSLCIKLISDDSFDIQKVSSKFNAIFSRFYSANKINIQVDFLKNLGL